MIRVTCDYKVDKMVFCEDCKYCYKYWDYVDITDDLHWDLQILKHVCKNRNNVKSYYSCIYGKIDDYLDCDKLNSKCNCPYFKKKSLFRRFLSYIRMMFI